MININDMECYFYFAIVHLQALDKHVHFERSRRKAFVFISWNFVFAIMVFLLA